MRQNQLKAMAASGRPRSCLTLTVNTEIADSPAARYKALHNAWKLLIKRILRQFSKPPNQRWELVTDEGYPYYDLRSYSITKPIKAKKIRKIHYMAFAEETKLGEPHLHILLRTHFIPQAWLSQQMKELLQSPVVWIEKVHTERAAIAYVTKYVTKQPAQFGNSKRYWCSKYYRLRTKRTPPIIEMNRRNSQVVRQSFTDLVLETQHKGIILIPIAKGLLKSMRLKVSLNYYPNGPGEPLHPDLVAAYFWLSNARRDCGITTT